MRPISNLMALAGSTAVLVIVTAGCGGSAKTSSGETNAEQSAASVVTTAPTVSGSSGTMPTSEVAATTSAPGPAADPSVDPCELLTATVAAQALGVPVGGPKTQPGEGNTTCAYRPLDAGARGLVTLTVYGVPGSVAVLDQAARQLPGSESVDGLGDAARVSVQGQAIGVLSGSTVFAMGLYLQQPDGQLLPVSKAQLVDAARAVLDGR
jgi:hypothetical protein